MHRTLPCIALLLATAPSVALAVPAQLTTQGRILDADDAPLDGALDVSFRLMDSETGGSTLWEETQSVDFVNGFYTVLLGVDEADNPLEDDVLDQWPLYLEVQLDGEPAMVPRMAVGSVPYARQAGLAEELAPGADIDAGSLTVNGTEVVTADGEWTGSTPAVDWSDLSGIPGDFADGDDADTLAGLVCSDGQWAVWDGDSSAWGCEGFSDTTLTDPDVVVAVGTDVVDLYAGSTMDGYTLLTEDSAIDWSLLVSIPAGLDDGDDDTLAGLSCTDGQLAVYDTGSTAWTCGDDTDTTLTAAEVVTAVEAAASLALPGTTTVGGNSVLTTASTVPWSQLTSVPAGLADGDNDTLGALSCSGDAIPVYTGTAWTCGSDTDTTLTAAEVVAAVEAASAVAMTGTLSVGGYAVLTENSSLDWSQLTGVPTGLADGDDDTLAVLTCADGEVAAYDSTTGWACATAGGAETVSVGTLTAGSSTTVSLSQATDEVALTAYVQDGSDWVLVPVGISAGSAATCASCGDGSDGAFTPTTDLVLTCGEYDFTEVDIPSGVTVTTTGSDPMIIRSQGDVVVEGTIEMTPGTCGESSSGAGLDSPIYTSGTCTNVAAGGGSFGSAGSGGGYCNSGTPSTTAAGSPHWAVSGDLPVGGSPGGDALVSGRVYHEGGGGGGAIAFTAPLIEVVGDISANGGDGSTDVQRISGAGSGGHVWLKAETVVVSGQVSAEGGTAYSTSWPSCGCPTLGGGDGGDGYIRIDSDTYTLTGTASPTPLESSWTDSGSSSTTAVVSVSVDSTGTVTVTNESSSTQAIRLLATYAS